MSRPARAEAAPKLVTLTQVRKAFWYAIHRRDRAGVGHPDTQEELQLLTDVCDFLERQ